MLAVVVAVAISQGCYGTYQATRRINNWNGHATNNKVANSAIHLAMWIVPIYPLALFGDFFIFNNIEFITGSNPLGNTK